MSDTEKYLSALTGVFVTSRRNGRWAFSGAARLTEVIDLIAAAMLALAVSVMSFRRGGIVLAGIFVMARSLLSVCRVSEPELKKARRRQTRSLSLDLLITLLLGLHALVHSSEEGYSFFVSVLTVSALAGIKLLTYSRLALLLIAGRAALKNHPETMRRLDEAQLKGGGDWSFGSLFVLALASLFMMAGSSILPLVVIAVAANILWAVQSARFWISRWGLKS